MSDESMNVRRAFDNIDFAEVFADTPLAEEFEDEDAPVGETIGAFLGRHLGAWLGGVVGASVLDAALSGDSSESDPELTDGEADANAEDDNGDESSEGENATESEDETETGGDDEEGEES